MLKPTNTRCPKNKDQPYLSITHFKTLLLFQNQNSLETRRCSHQRCQSCRCHAAPEPVTEQQNTLSWRGPTRITKSHSRLPSGAPKSQPMSESSVQMPQTPGAPCRAPCPGEQTAFHCIAATSRIQYFIINTGLGTVFLSLDMLPSTPTTWSPQTTREVPVSHQLPCLLQDPM